MPYIGGGSEGDGIFHLRKTMMELKNEKEYNLALQLCENTVRVFIEPMRDDQCGVSEYNVKAMIMSILNTIERGDWRNK